MPLLRKPSRVKSTGHALFCDGIQMRRITRFSADASLTNEDLLELSNAGVAERIEDIDSIGCTVEAHENGANDNWRKMLNIFEINNDDDDNEAMALTDSSFDEAVVDFTLQVTSGTNTDALAYTTWFGSQFLTGYSANFSVDGNATESFTTEGELKRNFLNTYRDTRVISGAYTSSTSFTTPTNLQTGYTPLMITVDNEVTNDIKISSPQHTITLTGAVVTASPALDIKNGQRFRLIYAKNVADSFSNLTSTPDGLAGLRTGMTDVILRYYSGGKEKTLRLQSVSLDVSLDREELNQLGSDTAYSRSLTRPIDVSISIEAKTSDLEEYAKFANQETGFDNDSLNWIDVADYSNDATLEVDMYKNETNHSKANFLKKYVVSGLSLATDNIEVTAGSDGTTSWTFSADNFQIVSSGTSAFI